MSYNLLQYAQGEDISDVAPNSIGSADTSITVNSISLWNSNGGPIVINRGQSDQEYAIASGISGSSLTIAQRGAYGSTAVSHNANATVESVPFAHQWNDMLTSLMNVLVQSTGAVDNTKVVDLTSSQTLTNKTLTSPKVGTAITDTNGNEVIKTPATTSAVNEITVTNAATGDAPEISATGGDTNIDLQLSAKGTGRVTIDKVQGSASQANFPAFVGEYDNGNSGSSITIDWSKGDRQLLTVSASTTLSYSSAVKGQTLTLRVVENATGGFSVTLPTSKWPSGTAGTFTTTANAINLLVIYYDGTNYLTQLAPNFS